MKKFQLTPEKKTLTEPFEFELNGKTFKLECIDAKLMRLMTELESGDGKFDELVIHLIGKENYMKYKPFSYLEITMLLKWIHEEILNPFYKGEIEEPEVKNSPTK